MVVLYDSQASAGTCSRDGRALPAVRKDTELRRVSFRYVSRC